MGKTPTIYYVSPNHIKWSLGNSELSAKKGLNLIEALFPACIVDIFRQNVNINAKSDIDNFCMGNRKGNSLFNQPVLDILINNLQTNSTFISESLALARKWIESEPRITKTHPFFSILLRDANDSSPNENTHRPLVLISLRKPTNSQIKQFTLLLQTIRRLVNTGSTESLTYALFLLVMLGALQERFFEIPQRLYVLSENGTLDPQIDHYCFSKMDAPAERLTATENHVESPPSIYAKHPQQKDVYSFLSEAFTISNKEDIVSIDMAFHGGDQWLYHGHGNKTYLFNQMIEQGIPFRILVNTGASVKKICSHMRQKGVKYVGFTKAIAEWKTKAAESNGLLKVGVLDFPLLHRVYLVQKKDGTGSAHVTFYTYFKDFVPENEIIMCYHEGSREYNVIKNEFDYLWACAEK